MLRWVDGPGDEFLRVTTQQNGIKWFYCDSDKKKTFHFHFYHLEGINVTVNL